MRKNTRVLLCALTLLGCGSDTKTSPVDGGPDGEDSGPVHHYDAGVCPVVEKQISQKAVDQVDLLFMIDDSGSMKEEQANVAAQIPRLVEILATGDLNGDGKQDFAPVESLHLGVVSSDMGIFGADVINTCERKLGDDGLLRVKIQPGLTVNGFACDGANSLLPYQTYEAPNHESDRQGSAQIAANRFNCRAALGTHGCGLEQQLESVWKALAPSSDTDFVAGHGHGDAENKGFLRAGAVLAVVMVSDETDCSINEKGKSMFVNNAQFKYEPSAANGNIAGQSGRNEGLNFRCSDETFKDLLQPPAHYIDGLKSLKPDAPDRIIFTAITGVPEVAEDMTVGAGASEVQDFDGILKLDEMQVFPGTNPGTGKPDVFTALPRPACKSENGQATPGRRFVEVAKGFGQNGLVRSICKADFKSAFDQTALRVASQLSGSCLPVAFNVTKDGILECDAIEVLPKGQTHCDAAKGRVPHGTRTVKGAAGDEQRTACKINQVAVKAGQLVPGPHPLADVNARVGWFYDSFSPDVMKDCPAGAQQRIAFTVGADAQADSIIDLVCRDPSVKADPGDCSF